MRSARGLRRALLAGCAVAALAGASWLRWGPLPEGLLDLTPRLSTKIVDRHGETLHEAPSGFGARGRQLEPQRLPRWLVRATLAAEDHRFFHHPGVDPIAIVRAAWRNLRAGAAVEGGSTITQQTVKLLSARPRTLAGKASEAVWALRLESRLDKQQILALYLSAAYYGNGLVGAEAASETYFGSSLRNLTPAQAALLAGLPRAPSALDPYRHPERARERQRVVLSRMAALGYLSGSELQRARAEQLRLVRTGHPLRAPHFALRALAVAGRAAVRVETTLDAGLQREVARILRAHAGRLEQVGARHVAVAVLDNARAEWLAWEGSGDWFDPDGGAIDGVRAPRQPGSALKPFTYALAFESGLTPASALPDVPSHFPTAQPGVAYSPSNYDGNFRGPLRARLALAGSENVPAVWALERVGVARLLALLRATGLTTLDNTAEHYGYALTMGAAEVRLDELVSAYATLARGGVAVAPRMIRAAVAADGSRRSERRGESHRVISPRAAFWVADVLADAEARRYAFGTGGGLDFPFPVAVKTGTSQAYRDAWTLGFTRELTVGVWVGNFDRRELHASSGATAAAPVFHDVLIAAQRHLRGRLPEPGDPVLVERPRGLAPRTICALSGLEPTGACVRLASEWLPRDEERPPCPWHVRRGDTVVVAWPARYRPWARERGLLAPVDAPEAAVALREPGLRIVNPPPGAVYLLDPTLRAGFQTVPLRAERSGAQAGLVWSVDGRELGTASADAALDWELSPGRHTIGVRDAGGERDEVRIVVR